jgi:anti-sigma regulatory factor (Ser/Thr protein kinase)
MAQELALQINAHFGAISGANDSVSKWLTDQNVHSSVQYLANLAIEELVTNCIKYGYQDHREHVIDIRLQIADNQLAVTVIDDGCPFNPLDAPEPNTHLPIERRPVGGLGIHLLRQMSDKMEYSRSNGRNHTTVRKSINP